MQVIAAALLVTMGMMVGVSCGDPDAGTPGYKVFTQRRGVGHFSLEYPSTYRNARAHVRDDSGYVDVGFVGPELEIRGAEFYPMLDVFVQRRDAKELSSIMERDILLARSQSNFVLFDRSPVAISGTMGEQVVYSYDAIQAPRGTFYPPDEPHVIRRVYLFQRGNIWLIKMISHSDLADEAAVVFEHALKTFKILE